MACVGCNAERQPEAGARCGPRAICGRTISITDGVRPPSKGALTPGRGPLFHSLRAPIVSPPPARSDLGERGRWRPQAEPHPVWHRDAAGFVGPGGWRLRRGPVSCLPACCCTSHATYGPLLPVCGVRCPTAPAAGNPPINSPILTNQMQRRPTRLAGCKGWAKELYAARLPIQPVRSQSLGTVTPCARARWNACRFRVANCPSSRPVRSWQGWGRPCRRPACRAWRPPRRARAPRSRAALQPRPLPRTWRRSQVRRAWHRRWCWRGDTSRSCLGVLGLCSF